MSRLKTDAIRNVNASVDGITLDTSGNVAIPNKIGIDETSPQEKLHIGAGGKIRFERSDGTRYGELWNDNNFVELKASTDPIRLNAQSYIRFDIASNEKLRILSNGDIGFGITAPTTQSGRVLHLHAGAAQQRFHMTNNTTGSGASDGFEIIVEQSANVRIRNFEAGALMFDSGGPNNEAMRIDSDGRVLIGQTSSTSSSKLCVYGAVSTEEAFFELNRTDDPANNQNIGVIEFSQGSAASRLAARIMTRRDGGVWGASSLPTRFEFHTCVSGSNTAAERVRISSNGNLNILDGDLQIGTSGHGIDFSATGNGNGTMGDELLDDYEQGTWSPTIYGGTTAGSYSYQANRTGGKYTRIGNMVYIEGVLRIESITTAGAGDLYMGGMPYSTSAPMASAWTMGKGVQFFMYGTNGNTTASIAEPPFVGTASGGQSAFNIRSYGKNLNVMPQIEDFDNQWWIFQVAGWYPVN